MFFYSLVRNAQLIRNFFVCEIGGSNQFDSVRLFDKEFDRNVFYLKATSFSTLN